ncbi:MAG: hypothetical protein V4737_12400 [Curtobacterium sp.]
MVVVQRRSGSPFLRPGVLVVAGALVVPSVVLALVVLVGSAMRSVEVLNAALVLQSVVIGLEVLLVFWLLLGLAISLLGSLGRGISVSPVGDETPDGDHWVVQSLAARSAGDGTAALRLTVRTLQGLPSGRVLVAVARTEKLLQDYVKLGFSRGEKQRVYKAT